MMRSSVRVKVTAGIIACAMLLIAGATAASAAAAAISPASRQAIIEAATANFKAAALYKAIASKHKDVRPFSNWAKSDRGEELKALFPKYGVPLPADPFAGRVPAPASVADSCTAAKQTEAGLVSMYERLLRAVTESDIVAVFTDMREGSKRRLQALERQCS